MSNAGRMVVAGLALAAVGGAGAPWVWVRPWVVGPDEPGADIEARWSRLVDAAALPEARVKHEGLDRAATTMSGVAVPEGDGAPLPPETEEVVGLLMAWVEAKGDLGRELCALDQPSLGIGVFDP